MVEVLQMSVPESWMYGRLCIRFCAIASVPSLLCVQVRPAELNLVSPAHEPGWYRSFNNEKEKVLSSLFYLHGIFIADPSEKS